MKYLHSRDNYLQKVSERKLQKQEEIANYQLQKIYENAPGSGALGNEINWGDSLLGRLINSVLRKAQEGINTMRMTRLIAALKSHFQYILGMSMVGYLTEEDKAKWTKIQIAQLLRALTNAVEEGYKVGKIKETCDITISEIKKLEVTEESKDTKEELLKKLEEFREWLNQFKDDEGDLNPEDEDEDENDESEEGSDEGSDEESSLSSESLYPTMIKALKSLSLILTNYKKIQIKPKAARATYVTVKDDTLKKIEANPLNTKKLKPNEILAKNQMVNHNGQRKKFSEYFKPGMDKNTQLLPAGIELVLENLEYLYEAGPIAGSNKQGSSQPIGSGSGEKRNVTAEGEDHLTQAYNKLKKACEILESSKEKGIGITVDFLNSITSKSVDENTKKVVKELFVEINRYLVGDKKSTLNAMSDPLYKESLEIISDKNKKITVAEKIARFTVRAMQFDGENLYGGLGELGKPLKEYVEAFKALNKMKAGGSEKKKEENKEENKVKAQKESFMRTYSNFMLIREAEGDNEDEAEEEEEGGSVSDQIREYFAKNFDFEYWAITQEEVDEVTKKVDLSKDKKIVIRGTGPILEVMRLFNRAYKIHTKNVIPFSGRTDGKLNAITMNQWTAFGSSGSGEMKGKGDGPYRNNKLFNQWEDAVYDILKNYEPVFEAGTILIVGDREKNEAGVALRGLMMDLLDGDDLYKSGDKYSAEGGGAQKRALNKYFDDVPELVEKIEKDPGAASLKGEDGQLDSESNEELASEIKDQNFSFVLRDTYLKDSDLKNNRPSELEHSFFGLDVKNEKGEQRYLFGLIREVKGDNVYIQWSKNFWFFERCLEQLNGPKHKFVQKDLKINLIPGGGEHKVWATKMKKNDLFVNLKQGNKLKFNSVSDKNESKSETLQVNRVTWLAKEIEKDKKYDFYKVSDWSKFRNLLVSMRFFSVDNVSQHVDRNSKKENDELITKKV